MACQHDYLIDIYDGAMWKSFLYHDSKPLLEHEHPQIWLQPFECAQYSVGIMYLICFKLPRPQTIVVGCIPGPKVLMDI